MRVIAFDVDEAGQEIVYRGVVEAAGDVHRRCLSGGCFSKDQ